ncbi:hypothetical protein J5X84_37520 [Streptosporangiaceae bacterium NEAU-GS5]|nr:hypothetical protein [Streptosporangiaceae bacterium NEAU-GS5]
MSLVAALLLAAACGGGGQPAAAPAPPAPSAARSATPEDQAEALRPGCLIPDERVTIGTPSSGATVIVLAGSGPKGVVFAPQRGENACQWIVKARELAGKGYHVATFSWGNPEKDSLPAAVEALRAEGASKLVLVGASAGGGLVLLEAGGLDVAGVVALSPVDFYGGEPGLAAYKGPLLMATGVRDAYPTLETVEEFAAVHPGPEKLIKVAGGSHGVQLLIGDDALNAAIDAFIRESLGL